MFTVIVAHDKNLLIGNDLQIPWHVKEDFQHFKKTTLNHTIIMGLNTYKSIGKALPNRKTIVVNFTPVPEIQDAEVCTSLDELINKYKDSDEEVFVCGGASIYRQLLPYCQNLIISVIKGDYKGNIYFPEYRDAFKLDEAIEQEKFTINYYSKKVGI